MCMFCAAIPVTAATGLALDSKQRKKHQSAGLSTPRIRLILLAMVLIIFLLMIASAYFHTKFPRYF